MDLGPTAKRRTERFANRVVREIPLLQGEEEKAWNIRCDFKILGQKRKGKRGKIWKKNDQSQGGGDT